MYRLELFSTSCNNARMLSMVDYNNGTVKFCLIGELWASCMWYLMAMICMLCGHCSWMGYELGVSRWCVIDEWASLLLIFSFFEVSFCQEYSIKENIFAYTHQYPFLKYYEQHFLLNGPMTNKDMAEMFILKAWNHLVAFIHIKWKFWLCKLGLYMSHQSFSPDSWHLRDSLKDRKNI